MLQKRHLPDRDGSHPTSLKVQMIRVIVAIQATEHNIKISSSSPSEQVICKTFTVLLSVTVFYETVWVSGDKDKKLGCKVETAKLQTLEKKKELERSYVYHSLKMGIQGLMKELKPLGVEKSVKQLSGQTCGVDVYHWLHKGGYGVSRETVLGRPCKKLAI